MTYFSAKCGLTVVLNPDKILPGIFLSLALQQGSCTLADPACLAQDATCNPGAVMFGAGARVPVVQNPTPNAAYTSCADVRSKLPGAADGDYVLTLSGGTITVFCYNMASAPTEYLTFQNCNANGQPNANSSYYAQGVSNINVTAGGLWTWYNRVRFDPSNLTVDQTDRTFSSNNGGDRWFGATHFFDNDYANASACGCDGTVGIANIDLTGIPLTVAPGQFTVFAGPGSINYGPGNKTVDLTGGGCCGGTTTTVAGLQLSW